MQNFEFNGSITTFASETRMVFNNIQNNIIYYAEKNNLYIADLKTNKKEYIATRHNNNINSLSFIPKKNLLITSDITGYIVLTCTSLHTEISVFKAGPGLLSLSVSSCGGFLLSFYKGKVKVYSIQDKTITLIFAYTNLTDTVVKSKFIETVNDESLTCLCQTLDNKIIAIEIVFTNFSKLYCSLVKHIITQRSNKINDFYGNNGYIYILQNNYKLLIYEIRKLENKTKIVKDKEINLEKPVLGISFYKVEEDSINITTMDKLGKLKIHSLKNNTDLSTVFEMEYTEKSEIETLLSFNCNTDGSFILIKYISNKSTHLGILEWSINNKTFNLISPVNNKASSFDVKENYLAYGDDSGILHIYKYINGEDGKLITSFIKSIKTIENYNSKINNIKWITNSLLLCSNLQGDLMLVNTNYDTVKTIYKSEDRIISLNIEKRTEEILIYFSEFDNNKVIVYSYNANDILLELDAHKLPVNTLLTCKEGLISSGYDGKIIKWNFLRQQEETRAFKSKNIIKSKITNQTFKIKDTTDMGVVYSNSIKFRTSKYEAHFLGCITEESHFILFDTVEFNMVLDYNFQGDVTPNASKDALFTNTQSLMKTFVVLSNPIIENTTFKAFLAFVSSSNEICIYSLNLKIVNFKPVFAEIIHTASYTMKLNLEDYTKLKFHKSESKTKKIKVNDGNGDNKKGLKIVRLFNEFDEDSTVKNANEMLDIKVDKGNIFVSTSTEGIVILSERNYLSKSSLSSIKLTNKNINNKEGYEDKLDNKINHIDDKTVLTIITSLFIEVLDTMNIGFFEKFLTKVTTLKLDLENIISKLNFTYLIVVLGHIKHYLKKECINIERVNLLLKIIVKQRKEYLKNKRQILNESNVNYYKEREFTECLNEVYYIHETVTEKLKEKTDKFVCMLKLFIE